MTATVDASEIPATPLFGGISEEDWPELLEAASRMEMGSGQTVFRQGEAADAFFVVLSGLVEVSARGHGGERVLAELGAGAVVGETSLLVSGDRSASVKTKEPTVLLRFPDAVFLEMLDRGSRGAERVLFNIAKALASRLRSTDAQLGALDADQGTTDVLRTDLVRLRKIFFTEWVS